MLLNISVLQVPEMRAEHSSAGSVGQRSWEPVHELSAVQSSFRGQPVHECCHQECPRVECHPHPIKYSESTTNSHSVQEETVKSSSRGLSQKETEM